jgi:FkbM family methyltransferase
MLRIAHFAVWGPNRCGLYHTVKDLILAERDAGLDAGFVALSDANKIEAGRRDGPIASVDQDWCKKADVFVRHSGIPPLMQTWGVPLILAMHGRPESSFRLERDQSNRVVTAFYNKARDKRYKAFVTFWREYMLPWSAIIPPKRLFYVPAPVDLNYYGSGNDLRLEGQPRILIADVWREDVTPFNVIWGIVKFAQRTKANAKLYIVGLSGKAEWGAFTPFRKGLKTMGVLGDCVRLTKNIRDWYASCDMLVTPHVIATRSIRESLASGLPVVAGTGCRYTPFAANPMDAEGVAQQIENCWLAQGTGVAARKMAEESFSFEQAGGLMRSLACKVMTPSAGKKKILVDIGGHQGETITRFYREVDDAAHWEIHCFEPDATNAEYIHKTYSQVPNLTVYPAAMWTQDGSMPLYVGSAHDGEGSTLLAGKQTGAVNYNSPVWARTLDITKWLGQHPADYTVVKMNIEGAEYELLPHLAETGALAKIDELYVQTHAAKFQGDKRRLYDGIERRFRKEATRFKTKLFFAEKGMVPFGSV